MESDTRSSEQYSTESVELKSRMLDGGIRHLRAINQFVTVEREPSTKMFGNIIGVTAENSFDVVFSKVLGISARAKVMFRDGPLKVGDRVLSVRVVRKGIEDLDMRTDAGAKVGFLPDEHILARVDDDIHPANDLLLVAGQPDRKQYGLIELVGATSGLQVVSSKILSLGPHVSQGEPGEFAVYSAANGCAVDSFEIRRRFGYNLRLIREKSLMGISVVEIEEDPNLEVNPEYVPEQHRGLIAR